MNQPEKEIRINPMGSEVEAGFRCKPVHRNPDRPVMYYRHHILLCTGERCRSAAPERELADEFRTELEELDLHRGKNRIKVTRANCFGACRFRSVALLYENGTDPVNNGVWIKQIHRFNWESRRRLFESLVKGEPVTESPNGKWMIPMEEPEES